MGKRGEGKFALVSKEDFEFLCQWTWNATPKGYAIRTCRAIEKKTVYMHVEVAKRCGIFSEGLQVDHINREKLDNRRANLRSTTNQMNQANVGLSKNNSSGAKGVSYRPDRKKPWIARIGVNGKRIQIGSFNTKQEAIEAYSIAAREHFGEFANV